MSRLILTFPTMFDVLAADKLLRQNISCRPTPTPPGLSAAICGMSLELLNPDERDKALAMLNSGQLNPAGIHQLD